MIRKLMSVLLLLVLCITMTACSFKKNDASDDIAVEDTEHDDFSQTDETEKESVITPLLYKVTNDTGNTVWLFGSIHIGEEYFYPLPEYVLNAFEDADALAVEFDIVAFSKDLIGQTQALSKLVYTDGTTIEDHISPELYAQAVEIFKENSFYLKTYDHYMPIFWSSNIDNALYAKYGADSKYGVDQHMIKLAYKEDKEVLDVESAELQYNMLAGFSDGLQELMLENSVEMFYAEEAYEEIQLLINSWAEGDAEGVEQISNAVPESLTEEELLLYEEYTNKLICERNLSMTDYAEQALISGNEIFICVGAAHIVGEGAMAELLAERGYTVEMIKQ
ncbi:MAG: TraB/GumN family protein [Clostridia bacterium]|nr:TraB/GumN family protein [Clostridia bacterium]